MTGGFKVMSGFSQFVGIIYQSDVYYVHEFGEEIVRVPKLPITWKVQEDFKPYVYLLDKLREEGVIPKGEWEKVTSNLPSDIKELLDDLIEELEDKGEMYVGLSATAEVFVSRFFSTLSKQREGWKAFICRSTLRAKIKGYQKEVETMLSSLIDKLIENQSINRYFIRSFKNWYILRYPEEEAHKNLRMFLAVDINDKKIIILDVLLHNDYDKIKADNKLPDAWTRCLRDYESRCLPIYFDATTGKPKLMI